MIKINFTEKEFNKIKEVRNHFRNYGLYLVLDGFVDEEDSVWWHMEDGPELIKVNRVHGNNISNFPEYHSIKKPKIKQEVAYEPMFEEE